MQQVEITKGGRGFRKEERERPKLKEGNRRGENGSKEEREKERIIAGGNDERGKRLERGRDRKTKLKEGNRSRGRGKE